ncbi:uncharacterized protein LOC111380720 [Olea europaea var. sylvestris]|uniref:uncharacterized protein LOC111380720 n=1 Tax=Olea europaea var. sylvestris TaxID=158386 RepID=UPI000C1D64AE|nr:uncharacterized protein LOC111380720 [Olea europaea var. sylvestris]
MRKAFPQTLTNVAKDWFSTLEPNSIASFLDLANKFSTFFPSSKKILKIVASLMQLCQGQNETLRNFITRFNKERLQIPDLPITATVSALTYAIRCEAFKMSLSKTPPPSVTDLFTRAKKYVNMEDTMFPRKDVTPPTKPEHKGLHEFNLHQDQIKDMKELKWPSRMKSYLESGVTNKYCKFHRDHRHTTEGCFSLNYNKQSRNNQNKDKAVGDQGNQQRTTGTINIIIGGTTSGGDSSNELKLYARPYLAVSSIDLDRMENITFGPGDSEGVSFPYDDVFVISAIIANFEMGISTKQLKQIRVLLQGFDSGVVTSEGITELPLTLGSEGKQVTWFITFHVVRAPMAYNAILGRPLLNGIKVIVSTFHLAMKFPTSNGIGVVRGNQKCGQRVLRF